jgi:hypothetical protein
MVTNLSNWTVGAMQSFGAGTTERNYWVLTHGTSNAEILIGHPNGTSSNYDNDFHVDYRNRFFGANVNQYLAIAFAPEGGYASSFSGADDPQNSTFWPASSGPAHFMYGVQNGSNLDFWFITDDSRAELTVYARNNTDDNGSCLVCGDVVFDDSWISLPLFTDKGSIVFNATDAWVTQPRDPSISWTGHSTTGSPRTSNTSIELVSHLTSVVDSNQPLNDSTYVTSLLPIWEDVGPEYPFYGWVNSEIGRMCGRTNSDTYQTKRGTSTAYKLYHLFRDVWTPWDDSLTVP